MFSPQHRSPLHCHTQYVLGFPNITPLVMSIVFSVLRQCGGLYKVGGGVSLPLLSEFGDCGRFLFEQLFLIVSVCTILVLVRSETIAHGWELV